MTEMIRRARTIVVCIAALLVAACGESPTASERGILRVATSTLGDDLDEDGYLFQVDSELRLPIGATEKANRGVSPGTHVVTLEGVAENCLVQGTQSRSVTVEEGKTVEVQFIVTCEATGVRISTSTTGPDQPPGHVVKSGERLVTVATNGAAILSRLQPGTHAVSLNLADNCTVAGTNPVSVTVANRALTPVSFEIVCAATAKHIVFVRDTLLSGNVFAMSILVAAPDGSSVLRLADGYSPAWSPDGTRIAYSDADCDYYYDAACDGGVIIMDLQTRTVGRSANGASGFDPAWSPDGKFIAFSRVGGFYATLHMIDSDGSGLRELTPNVDTRRASWSPDGKRVVFGCSPGFQRTEICIVNSDGTGLVQLTTDRFWDSAPAWSPDGSTIAFATNRFTPNARDIALMSPDGGPITRLTNGYDPAWLPDGSWLIFAGGDGLFTIGRDGLNRTRLTTGSHRAPAWRP